MTDKQVRLLQYGVAGTVAVVSTILIFIQLSDSGPYLVGTNHVPPQRFTVQLERGEEACQAGQEIAEDTASIGFRTATTRQNASLLRLSVRSRVDRYTVGRPDSFYQGDIRFNVPRYRRARSATICLANRGRKVDLAGVGSFYPNLPRNRTNKIAIDGKGEKAQVAITFWGQGEKSALGSAPTIARRAALFRPALIGGWFYLIVPLLLLAMALIAIKLLVRRSNN